MAASAVWRNNPMIRMVAISNSQAGQSMLRCVVNWVAYQKAIIASVLLASSRDAESWKEGRVVSRRSQILRGPQFSLVYVLFLMCWMPSVFLFRYIQCVQYVEVVPGSFWVIFHLVCGGCDVKSKTRLSCWCRGLRHCFGVQKEICSLV